MGLDSLTMLHEYLTIDLQMYMSFSPMKMIGEMMSNEMK